MLKNVAEKIRAAEKIAIFNHENPDGDALGSAYALKLIIEAMGKKAEVFLREGDERTKEYALIKGVESSDLSVEECDLKIAVDCADIKRLGSLQEFFKGNTAAIDHHMTHVEFAQCTCVQDAPATGEIIFDVAKELGVEITYDMAHNMYVAIICDTGSFKFSSTTAKTHYVASQLLETGIDVGEISKKVFDTKSFDYLRTYRWGIDRLELLEDGKISVLAITNQDFEELGVDETVIDGIVELPRSVEGVEVGAYIRQKEDGAFKVSLRSNGGVDVAKVSVAFGGGGHIKASGFLIRKDIDTVKAELAEEIKKQL